MAAWAPSSIGGALTRRLVIPLIGELPSMLDRIDAWIADGVLGGEQLNAADFMVAPCLALILYRPDAPPLFEGRPALELVDRLLPQPG
jgi:glutathione S-transferase